MVSPKRIVSKQLGELLVERGVLSQHQLDKALGFQREKGGLIGQILVELGFAKEEDIARALTTQYGLPFLPLANYEINPEAVGLVPENVARQYCLIPIDKIGDTLTIAIANPLNMQAIEDIEYITKCSIQIFVSTMSDVNNAIKRCYKK